MIKQADIVAYTNRFKDLATLCHEMVTPEDKKVAWYIWVLPHPIQGLVTALNSTTYERDKRIPFNLIN